MNGRVVVAMLLATGVALALRCPNLAVRPMHNDEAVNAVKFGQLWQHHSWRYDPNEHHGPTLPYATLALGYVTRAPGYLDWNESRLRVLTVLFAVGVIFLLLGLADGLGSIGAVYAMLFAAVSPAMVFYSRYYIHEMPLIFFSLLALAAGWRYWQTRRLIWALLTGGAIGLMQATKETFVISIAAAGLALGMNQLWNRLLDATSPPFRPLPLNLLHILAGLGAWLAIWVLLFSSFFTNWAGPLDAVRTYTPWLHRASGASDHLHPWYFYIQRLIYFHAPKGPVWSEALILVLALVGSGAAFARRGLGKANPSLIRFLALFTLILTAAYSFLSYKTPWCLLNFWLGMLLLAGVGAAVLLKVARFQWARLAMGILLTAGTAQLAAQAWQAANQYAADPRNPYVYAQTSPDLLNLVRKVEAVTQVEPQPERTLVKIIAPDDDYWPLPWYLRRFSQTGWYNRLPTDPFAPVMIVSRQLDARLDESKTHPMVQMFQLRPGVFLELYVEADLWRRYVEKNPPPQSADE
jgi:uncharacterized protein (TIGR03663 family)